MPDADGRIRGISVPSVPWHESKELQGPRNIPEITDQGQRDYLESLTRLDESALDTKRGAEQRAATKERVARILGSGTKPDDGSQAPVSPKPLGTLSQPQRCVVCGDINCNCPE